MDYEPRTPLFVGTAVRNNGMLSNSAKFMGVSTKPWGKTFDPFVAAQKPDEFVELFVGVGASNNEIVTPDFNYRNDGTQTIGFLSKKVIMEGQLAVYVGRGPTANGECTPNNGHKGEPTELVGYTLP
jgi:hypothetical protein